MEETRTFELAGIGERFIAIVIDTIIIGIIGGIFGVQAGWWGGSIVGFVLGAFYQWYFLTQQNGQTLGKKLVGIRVVKADGSPITDADAVLRYIGYMLNSIPILIGLPWLWAAFDKQSQGLQDKIANTYVVKASSARNFVVQEKQKNTL